ncbi:MAG: sugar ABC transporter permease [Anaerolineae bacterium]|nr:sugar ABC transporter permease [Anaerolineae bacterium]
MAIARRRPLSLGRREAIWAYVLISPWIIGFIVFTAGPMVASLGLSMTNYDVVNTPVFLGATNYAKMLTQDRQFWHSLRVTLTYAVVAVPLGLLCGFALALMLNAKIALVSVWRTIYYVPAVVSGVAVAILWSTLFNPRFGIVNWILSWFGIRGPAWLNSPDWALPALIVMSLWGVGGGMIIYLAGLQGIPTTLYDAAMVDGANAWHRLRHVTLPMMTPIIFYNLVMGVIGTFQYFTNAYVMTRGGPVEATLFYNLYLYFNAFSYMKMGYASALAWVLFVIVLLLTLLIFRSSAAWVYYEGSLKR